MSSDNGPDLALLELFGLAGYAPVWRDVSQQEQDALRDRVYEAGSIDRLLPADRERLEAAAAITRAGGSPFLVPESSDWTAEDAELGDGPQTKALFDLGDDWVGL